ncbi:MAG TPA: hypothetical protein VN328_06750 [Thermodesulfovibrionales bacterium]|nr:hypothetical protein [Thermodesulfovibrionales bacterium]
MTDIITEIHENTMEALGRISSFWGFSKIMGQIYGLLYLSPKPLTLDDMAKSLSASKGNVSINMKALERWNMVRQIWVKGDRKDYYEAETDFWKIVRGVLREREKKEFDQALSSIGNTLRKADETYKKSKTTDVAFVKERLKKLEAFIANMDKLVSVFLTLEDLKSNFWKIGGKHTET